MHKSKLFAILVFFISGFVWAMGPMYLLYNESEDVQDEIVDSRWTRPPVEEPLPEVAAGDVLQEFNRRFDQITQEIFRISDPQTKVRVLYERIEEIEKFRGEKGYSRVQDEVAMDLTLQTLKTIPRVGKFKIEKCELYQTKIFVHFDSSQSSENEPKEPSVKKAFKIFKNICG